MRTPNYKEPREVVGLSYFPWNTHRHCVYYDPADPACDDNRSWSTLYRAHSCLGDQGNSKRQRNT